MLSATITAGRECISIHAPERTTLIVPVGRLNRKTGTIGVVRAALVGCLLLLCAFNSSGALISTFQAGDSGWHLGTIGVGNLDGTPDLEIVVAHRDSTGAWFLDAFKHTGQRLAGFPYAAGGEP